MNDFDKEKNSEDKVSDKQSQNDESAENCSDK